MNSKLLRHSITAIAHSPQGTRQTLADNSVIRERHGHEIFVCMYMEQRDCKSDGTVIFPFFLQYDLPGHRLAQFDRTATLSYASASIHFLRLQNYAVKPV